MKKTISSILVVVVAACGAHSTIGHSPEHVQHRRGVNTLDKKAQLMKWHELDVKCHQLLGETAGPEVCAQRAQVENQLEKQGFCHGKNGEPVDERTWYRCATDKPGSRQNH